MFKLLSAMEFLLCLAAPARAGSDPSITVKPVPAGSGVWLVAQSANITPFTVTLNVTGDNIVSSRKRSITLDSFGKRSIPVLYLKAEDPKLPWNYRFVFQAHAGERRRGALKPYVYALPYANSNYRVSQGNLGTFSHFRGSQCEYAIDWAMPVGTVVRAARGGTVVAVRSDSDRGGPDPSFANDGNYVIVKHGDGTFGEYCHLKLHGNLVALGQRVAAGQPIALSGNTGHSTEPHLHFDVFNNITGSQHVTIPIKFKTRTGEVVVPHQGETY
ncbi:MAG: M23 family metallopeptidase [Capsulimonas sp.]|uniref:M23 family metallopeptidase n=1 Tax=Capsulimonas sp. TaxID=2494211 RepID=UPI003263FFC9